MPSNQQRREAAKRKLERQLVRRDERAKARRQQLLVAGVVIAVLVVGGVIAFVTLRKPSSTADSSTASGSSGESATPSSAAPATPCSYPTADAPKAVKPVTPPTNLSPANTGTVTSTLTLNGQPVTITLDRKAAPCAVNSFLSLSAQKFYDGTDCWRLTASDALNVLQCGDPSGKGNGGPGYTFGDENATATKFPAGTVAMANAGQGSNGSQFFLVYQDSVLAGGGYSVFGKLDAAGLKVVVDIAAKGVAGGVQTGAPVQKATISAVTVPDGALAATGSYPSSAPPSAPPLPGDPGGPGGPQPSGPEGPSAPGSAPATSGADGSGAPASSGAGGSSAP